MAATADVMTEVFFAARRAVSERQPPVRYLPRSPCLLAGMLCALVNPVV